jgi:hypothetical protein
VVVWTEFYWHIYFVEKGLGKQTTAVFLGKLVEPAQISFPLYKQLIFGHFSAFIHLKGS